MYDFSTHQRFAGFKSIPLPLSDISLVRPRQRTLILMQLFFLFHHNWMISFMLLSLFTGVVRVCAAFSCAWKVCVCVPARVHVSFFYTACSLPHTDIPTFLCFSLFLCSVYISTVCAVSASCSQRLLCASIDYFPTAYWFGVMGQRR